MAHQASRSSHLITDESGNEVLSSSTSPRERSRLSWLAATILLINLGLVFLFLAGNYWFGSTASALAYLRGAALIPDAYAKDFGTSRVGERPLVTFYLANYLDHTVTIIGFQSKCTCVYSSRLPLTIQPGQVAPLVVNIRPNSHRIKISEQFKVYIDDKETPSLLLTVTGKFGI